MEIIKTLHVFAVFVWVGNLLALSRLLGYHAKLTPSTQKEMIVYYRRMYSFVGFPTMLLSLCLGLMLIGNINLSYNPMWFHIKLAVILLLVGMDMYLGKRISQLEGKTLEGRGVEFKMLHGVLGLSLLAIMSCLFALRDYPKEVLWRMENDTRFVKKVTGKTAHTENSKDKMLTS